MRNRSGRRGGVLAIVLALIVAIIALAVAAIVVTGVFVAHSVHVEQSTEAGHETVRIETPAGAVRVGTHDGDLRRLGIPVYPGAALCPDCGKGADIELDFGSDRNRFSVTAAHYTTNDPAARVADFYRSELPSPSIKVRDHNRFTLEYSDRGRKRVVAIRQRRGHTEIEMVSFGEPGEN